MPLNALYRSISAQRFENTYLDRAPGVLRAAIPFRSVTSNISKSVGVRDFIPDRMMVALDHLSDA